MPIDPELLEILACPACKTPVRLVKNATALKCDQCDRVYPIVDDIPVMLVDEATVEPATNCVNVLLVRLRLIGDVVFTTPVVCALRRLRPQARLTYLVERAAAPVVAHLPALDEVIQVPHSRGVARLRDDLALGLRLRRERFDLVVDFHGGPRSSWLTWATGAPVRVGYAIKGRAWMYTHRVDRSPDLQPRHSVENQWDLLRVVAPEAGAPDRTRDRVVMHEDPGILATILQRLEMAGVGPEHELVVVHVSAGNPFRRWPIPAFADLVVRLSSVSRNRRIILTSGPSDASAAAEVTRIARAQLGRGSESIVEFGETTLMELRSVIGAAALYVGGDSGPLHVAATTDTPVVAVFGPTLRERSTPWRDDRLVTESVEPEPLPCRPCDQRTCAPGDFRCLTGLGADRVAAAAERALARAARLGPGSSI